MLLMLCSLCLGKELNRFAADKLTLHQVLPAQGQHQSVVHCSNLLTPQLAKAQLHASYTEAVRDLLPVLQLRLNKASELIHNSTNHKNLSMAKVIVHFQEIVDTVSSDSFHFDAPC